MAETFLDLRRNVSLSLPTPSSSLATLWIHVWDGLEIVCSWPLFQIYKPPIFCHFQCLHVAEHICLGRQVAFCGLCISHFSLRFWHFAHYSLHLHIIVFTCTVWITLCCIAGFVLSHANRALASRTVRFSSADCSTVTAIWNHCGPRGVRGKLFHVFSMASRARAPPPAPQNS